ncbi:MAG: four helix bundle protein [Polyangiaceae bacterium]
MDLKIYPVVLEMVRRLAPMRDVLRSHSKELGEQFERALISVPLNLAEGSYSRGGNRVAKYHVALGSAREALACLETAQAFGWIGPLAPECAALSQRVLGTLVRLVHPKR